MKQIKLSEENINKILEQIKSTLTKTSYSKKVTYTVEPELTVPGVPTKAHVVFESETYFKMKQLIQSCTDEVGWHCTAYREEPTDDTAIFSIKDIVVFPQVVTGATVTPDATKYALWLASQSDEVFNHLRFHGHSHVNMGTSPSGTDTNYQDSLLQQVNDFYIFGIFNKRNDNTMVIYDVENNVIYEDKDITLVTPDAAHEEWADGMLKEYVTKHSYATGKQTSFVNVNSSVTPNYTRRWNEVAHRWEYDWNDDKETKETKEAKEAKEAAKAAADLISKANRGEYAADYYESVNEGEAFYGTLKAGTVYYNDYNGCYCIKKSGYFDDPIKLKRQTAPAQKKTKGRKTNVK